VSGVGEAARVDAIAKGGRHGFADDDTTEWNVPGVDSFGETDEVWCDIPMVNCEPLAATTKTTHDFVTNHHDAITITNSANAFEVSRWWNQDSIDTGSDDTTSWEDLNFRDRPKFTPKIIQGGLSED
jgi:hypothetical protein